MYDALRRQCISSSVKFHQEGGVGRLSSVSITDPMFNSAQGPSCVNASFFYLIFACFTF